MLTAAIEFIPFLTCLFWLVLSPLVRKPDRQSRTLELLLAVTGTVSIAHAAVYYSTGTTLLVFFMIKQFFTPLLIPAALLYVSHLSPAITWKPYIPAWLGIPIALLFAESVLLMLSGTDGFTGAVSNTAGTDDKVAYLINLCSFSIFYTFLALQVTVWIILTIARLIKGKHHIQMLNCTALILAVAALEASAITGMPQWMGTAISVITAIIIFITSYTGVFKSKAVIRTPETEKPREIKEQPHESGAIIADAHQSIADEENLRIRFEDLIVTEQLFLKQGIRISDIATMLETNRTYVSRLVNNTYNMSFSDYMNTLRIDYAEQYLLHHKDAKQSDIAEACGFPNASAFNNVFKKITGVTPKVWLATRS